VKVTNNLPDSLTFVSCTATSGGVCAGEANNQTVMLPSLANTAQATVTIVATVKDILAEGTVINNTVMLESPTPDPDRSDNSATVTSTAYH
jgi:hypothetical protein